MATHTTPNPQEFCSKASFRSGGPYGIEAMLRGITYDVIPFGDDQVQVTEKDTGNPVATLGFVNGKFVVPGKES